MFDPGATVVSVHEVRVTQRGVRLTDGGKRVQVSTKSDFIAPDISPVRVIDLESEKGRRGWTDTEVKLSLAVNGGQIAGRAERDLAELQAGRSVIRKPAPTKVYRVWR